MEYKLVLASNSPRRRDLLAGLDIDFEVRIIPSISENYPDSLAVNDIPVFIAKEKAVPYLSELANDELVLTADTIVAVDGDVLGKPTGREDACEMLKKLSGKQHQVVTGVCLTTCQFQHAFSVVTDVTFKKLSDEEITYYVDSYKPFDKAGSYGIQEWIGYIGVTGINGSYFNVMGLPVQRIWDELKTCGVHVKMKK